MNVHNHATNGRCMHIKQSDVEGILKCVVQKQCDLLAGRAVTRVDHEEVSHHTTP